MADEDLDVLVDDDQPPEPEPPAKSGEPDKKPQPDEALSKENAVLRKRLAELEESERYWAGQAKAKREPAEKQPEADPLENDTPDALVDELASKGSDALRRRGFITKKELEGIVLGLLDQKLPEVTTRTLEDARLIQDFPDLSNDKSEFYAAVKQEYDRVSGGRKELAGNRELLRLAAEKVQLAQNGGKSKEERPTQTFRGGVRTNGYGDEDDMAGGLSRSQKSIISMFNRDGTDPITEDDYKKAARNVRVGNVRNLTGGAR